MIQNEVGTFPASSAYSTRKAIKQKKDDPKTASSKFAARKFTSGGAYAVTSAAAFLASSSSLALFACSFFWALNIARLARGRISRTCRGGITKGSRGRSRNGCSFPANILSLRSLSWRTRDVKHQAYLT